MCSGLPYLAAGVLLVGGACGRVGYDARLEIDAGTQGPNLFDANLGAILDSGLCGSLPASLCSTTTLVLPLPGGSTVSGGIFSVYGAPLASRCSGGTVAEHRTRIVAPDTPIRAVFEVISDQDVAFSIYEDSCQGPAMSCTFIPVGAVTEVGIEMQADQAVVATAAALTGCGEVTVEVAVESPGGT